MKSIRVSAPGKLHLLGEHTVVYGKPAIITAVDRRCFITVAPREDKKIEIICKKTYRAFNMQCYARVDIRVASDSNIYVLEVNANPCLAKDDEVAQSAGRRGISYNELIQNIINLSCKRSI